MTRHRLASMLAPILLGTVTLAGCNRDADEVDTTGALPAGETAASAEPAVLPPATPAADGAANTGAPPTSTARPVNVTAVDLGSAVGTDNRIATAATAFGRNDTVYVSVATDGSGSDSPVTAKWTYQDGQVVDTETRTIPAGPAVTAFRVSKPDGWPAGTYQVQIMVGDQLVETRDFTVR